MQRSNRPRLGSLLGVTLIELLIVLAVIGIMTAIAAGTVRSPSAQVLANDTRSLITQARLEAVKLSRPVAVRVDGGGIGSYRSASSMTIADACASTVVVSRRESSEYRSVSLLGTGSLAAGGFVWLPSGRLRSCPTGGAFAGSSVVITDSSSSRTVSVGIAGSVEVQ